MFFAHDTPHYSFTTFHPHPNHDILSHISSISSFLVCFPIICSQSHFTRPYVFLSLGSCIQIQVHDHNTGIPNHGVTICLSNCNTNISFIHKNCGRTCATDNNCSVTDQQRTDLKHWDVKRSHTRVRRSLNSQSPCVQAGHALMTKTRHLASALLIDFICDCKTAEHRCRSIDIP